MSVPSPDGSGGKASTCSAGDPCSIPGSGRSPGEGNGNPLQYSFLENSMDRGAWWAPGNGVPKRQTRLNNFTFLSSHQRIPAEEREQRSGLLAVSVADGTALRLIVPEIRQRGPHRQTGTVVVDQQRAALLVSPS